MVVVQNLLIYDVIGRRKILLDQMASGLKSLRFHDLMKKHSSVLEELFVRTMNITTEKVIRALQFMPEPDSQPPTVQTYLFVFLIFNCINKKNWSGKFKRLY